MLILPSSFYLSTSSSGLSQRRRLLAIFFIFTSFLFDSFEICHFSGSSFLLLIF
jgi:hypothetical protein